MATVPILDFAPLSELPKIYQQAQARKSLADLGRGLADGTLDYRQAAAKAAEMGDTDSTLKFLALDEQKKKQTLELQAANDFTSTLGRYYGGGQPAATAQPPQPMPQPVSAAEVGPGISSPVAPPLPMNTRPPVMPSAKVWGDDEGVAAGLYPAPKPPQVAQAQIAPAAVPSPTAPTPQATAQTTAPGGVPIPILLQAISNPRLPQAQRDMAKTLFTRALDEAKPPERIRMLQMLQANPELKALELEMRSAGGTKVNVDQRGESEFEKELGKGQAKRWNSYISAGEAAQKKQVDINNMRAISDRMGSQGKIADVKEVFGPYAEALGINVDGLSDIQAYSSIIQRLAPQQRAEGSGSTSDIEFKGFVKSLPGLAQNPAARTMTLDTMDALNRDEMARGEIATKLATKEITRVEAERQLRALPDPMAGFAEWRKANPGIYSQAIRGGVTGVGNRTKSGVPWSIE